MLPLGSPTHHDAHGVDERVGVFGFPAAGAEMRALRGDGEFAIERDREFAFAMFAPHDEAFDAKGIEKRPLNNHARLLDKS